MKKALRCLLSFVCAASLASATMAAHAVEKKTAKKTTAAQSSKAPAKSKSKAPARSTTSKSKKSATKANDIEIVKSCREVRVKTAKGYRTQRKCVAGESALRNPAGAGDLNAQQGTGKTAELKARTIPDRAYAVDGYTFFHQGRKYRVLGIDENVVPAGSDLAKQRLQMALDSGTINVEPETVDENGTMRALVRVGGKNLADVLNASR
ncbi:hypothetical protein VVD49_19505 [Uliginosibacterium sp. H3]|uniref:Uncharacterized protein n=1 Tax=Uliginosibacterium silvisoli TaxID=3114758 RepID=A0ABU6K8M8_9RHOO|nr:hypothetical protein [Uliginosibacterium sp. H3]